MIENNKKRVTRATYSSLYFRGNTIDQPYEFGIRSCIRLVSGIIWLW